MSQYCCSRMEYILKEPNSPLKYEVQTRCYFMEYHLNRKPRKNDVFIVEILDYCPWCGKKLPDDLTTEWVTLIKERFAIIDIFDKEQLKTIPQEYMTDEWWKKRGL